MVSTASEPQRFITDAWVKAGWDDFKTLADKPEYENSRFYLHWH